MATFPIWAWLVFGAFILLMLALDLFVLHRDAKEISFHEAALFSVFWIARALLFGVFGWAWSGRSCSAPSSSAIMKARNVSQESLSVGRPALAA